MITLEPLGNFCSKKKLKFQTLFKLPFFNSNTVVQIKRIQTDSGIEFFKYLERFFKKQRSDS